jgi:hypothetical protein
MRDIFKLFRFPYLFFGLIAELIFPLPGVVNDRSWLVSESMVVATSPRS